ncbi:MFS transporter [Microbacterium sp. ASV49]|uniref:MFS transporter n=1 Tax=Microbacterium candidum TaxID=3041922 RepID=A0ABT7N3N1_9MICO|nr:MFS transporter [Microbacterium sp. ASV49]MDL9981303.1 MFS transporter [Microbacterium sp. ASV49]
MTVTAPVPTLSPPTSHARLRYGALLTMMATSFVLVTSEFLPGGLLPDIAASIGVTPGQAGQMVTATAFAGLLVAPTIGLLLPRLDRRSLLVWAAIGAVISNAIVAIAPSLPLLLLGRLLLGAAISAFWAMSVTVAARIAGPERLGRAVMFTTAGMSLATVAGVPVGVLLSQVVGWRGVFGFGAAAAVLLAVALRWLLPSVPAEGSARLGTLIDTFRRPGIGIGVVGNILVVLGHFLAYTYVRLALERVQDGGAPLSEQTVIVLLALFGVGGLVGNIALGLIVDRTYRVLSVVTPLAIAAAVALMVAASGSVWAIGVIAILWGAFFASWGLIVNTWIGHRMPDRMEAGGGLVVTGFQTAIMIAAGAGGALLDGLGIETVYAIGAVVLVAGAVLFGLSGRISARAE